MSNILSQLHDSNANIAKFTSKFNGENKDTIRFIFDIERYEQVTNFQHPHTLFTNIYNALPEWIQYKFAQHRQEVITLQNMLLTNESTDEEKATAKIYTVESMQHFFVKNYRPTCKRSNIFRLLYSIRMRYNENPRVIVDRIATAVGYAQKAIAFMNAAGGEQMQEITDDDITGVLANTFCIKNNSPAEHNQGGINKLMQKEVRTKKAKYTSATKFKVYYQIAEKIVSEVAGMWYARDERHTIKYYDPQTLPLWETIIKKPKIHTTTKSKPNTHNPKYSGQKRPIQQRSQNVPPHKRRKYNPQTHSPTNINPIQCFRCGKRGHKAEVCYSVTDINSQQIRPTDRRTLNDMPFRANFKPQRTHIVPKYPNPINIKPPHYKPQKRSPWNQYPSQRYPQQNPRPSMPTPQQPTSITPSPQLHTLIGQLHEQASNNIHTDPSLLNTINTLYAQCNLLKDPQPRQSK